MSRGIYVALSGAVAQETALETTATNLANAANDGYERLRPVFREELSGATKRTGSGLHFSAIESTAIDGSRGSLRTTGRDLDIALPEGVYMAVDTARGERYTRAGALQVSPSGALTTSSGAKLLREDGKPLTVNVASPATISTDGTVMQDGNPVAKLKLVKLEQGSSLQHEGADLMTVRGRPPVKAEGVEIDLGSLEESNAPVVGSMVELVSASRTFEAFQRMLETFGELDRKVLSTIRGPTE